MNDLPIGVFDSGVGGLTVLHAIAERLLEAASRGMWAEPKQETLEALQALYLNSETSLEARGETPRGG